MEPDTQSAFEFETPVSAPVEAPAQPANLADMEAMMKRLMEPLMDKVKALEVENQTLRETVQEAQNLPGHLVQGADFAPDPRAARSVVIATRPVREEPGLYNRNKPVVDANGLSINNASPLSGKNAELR